MAVIKDLYFYPIKSFRGLRTAELTFDREGPLLDRQWMLVDDKNRFLTMRQMPLLTKIGLRIVDDAAIELSTPELGVVDFGLEERESAEFKVTVWKDEVPAFEVSSEISEWLSEVTGQKVRLVRLSENAKRGFSAEYPERYVRFTDAMPLQVISHAALRQLELKAGVTLAMVRFRPNIVIDEVEAHAEDSWPSFTVGKMNFAAMKPCTRCKITTVHPLTGEVGEEPLKTLETYRRIEKGIAFGYYFAHMNEGKIRVGDQVVPG